MAPLRYLCLAITTRLSIQLKATQYSGNLLQLMLHVCAECEPTHLIVCINLWLQPACSQPCVEPLKPPAFLEDTLWYWSVYKFVCLLPMPTSWPSSIAWEPYDGTDGHLACCIKSPLANPLGQTKKQPLVKQIIPLKLRSQLLVLYVSNIKCAKKNKENHNFCLIYCNIVWCAITESGETRRETDRERDISPISVHSSIWSD